MRFDGSIPDLSNLMLSLRGVLRNVSALKSLPPFPVSLLSLAFSVTSGVVSQVSPPGSLLYSAFPLVIYGLTHPSPANRWRG